MNIHYNKFTRSCSAWRKPQIDGSVLDKPESGYPLTNLAVSMRAPVVLQKKASYCVHDVLETTVPPSSKGDNSHHP
jgi:hypothetical protein